MGRSIFVGFAVFVAILAFVFTFIKPFQHHQPLRLFTPQELALCNGTDDKLPILLGILGSVFDVTKGKSHYGAGGSYNHFTGRDASRAFVSGNFTGVNTSVFGVGVNYRPFRLNIHIIYCRKLEMDSQTRYMGYRAVKSVVEWRDFYMRTYKFVGRLVGRYYNDQGQPTKHLKGAETKAARGAQLLEKQKIEEEKIPSCNSKWSQEEGGEVWCDSGYPRMMQRPVEIALTGKASKRCVCLQEQELGNPGLEIYKGFDYLAKACKV